MTLDSGQTKRVVELVENVPWGDIDGALRGTDEALLRALEATAPDLQRWEREGEETYNDEFSVTAEQLAEMDDEWRLAYVARLLKSFALVYGLGLDQVLVADHEPHTPAELLRGLNDIAMMPLTE